jgi:hypothetical protein
MTINSLFDWKHLYCSFSASFWVRYNVSSKGFHLCVVPIKKLLERLRKTSLVTVLFPLQQISLCLSLFSLEPLEQLDGSSRLAEYTQIHMCLTYWASTYNRCKI